MSSVESDHEGDPLSLPSSSKKKPGEQYPCPICDCFCSSTFSRNRHAVSKHRLCVDRNSNVWRASTSEIDECVKARSHDEVVKKEKRSGLASPAAHRTPSRRSPSKSEPKVFLDPIEVLALSHEYKSRNLVGPLESLVPTTSTFAVPLVPNLSKLRKSSSVPESLIRAPIPFASGTPDDISDSDSSSVPCASSVDSPTPSSSDIDSSSKMESGLLQPGIFPLPPNVKIRKVKKSKHHHKSRRHSVDNVSVHSSPSDFIDVEGLFDEAIVQSVVDPASKTEFGISLDIAGANQTLVDINREERHKSNIKQKESSQKSIPKEIKVKKPIVIVNNELVSPDVLSKILNPVVVPTFHPSTSTSKPTITNVSPEHVDVKRNNPIGELSRLEERLLFNRSREATVSRQSLDEPVCPDQVPTPTTADLVRPHPVFTAPRKTITFSDAPLFDHTLSGSSSFKDDLEMSLTPPTPCRSSSLIINHDKFDFSDKRWLLISDVERFITCSDRPWELEVLLSKIYGCMENINIDDLTLKIHRFLNAISEATSHIVICANDTPLHDSLEIVESINPDEAIIYSYDFEPRPVKESTVFSLVKSKAMLDRTVRAEILSRNKSSIDPGLIMCSIDSRPYSWALELLQKLRPPFCFADIKAKYIDTSDKEMAFEKEIELSAAIRAFKYVSKELSLSASTLTALPVDVMTIDFTMLHNINCSDDNIVDPRRFKKIRSD